MSALKKYRDVRLDLYRCLAVSNVLAIHFFLYIGFYEEPLSSPLMFLQLLLRTFLTICVPSFLLLTGYLMSKKNLSSHYYQGISHTLLTYLVVSLFCKLFKILFYGETFSAPLFLKGLLSFSEAPYSWYIEMYIGLYLLIPFLNAGYQALSSRTAKRCLLITLIVLTVLPGTINDFNLHLLPAYWELLWPFTYYFAGAYLREFLPTISYKKIFPLIVVLLILFSAFDFSLNYEKPYRSGYYNGYFGIITFILTVLCFVGIMNLKLESLPNPIRIFIHKVSELSLGIYLSSWIMDSWIYRQSFILDIVTPLRIKYFVPVIFIVFTGSFCISAISESIVQLIFQLYSLLRTRISTFFTKFTVK